MIELRCVQTKFKNEILYHTWHWQRVGTGLVHTYSGVLGILFSLQQQAFRLVPWIWYSKNVTTHVLPLPCHGLSIPFGSVEAIVDRESRSPAKLPRGITVFQSWYYIRADLDVGNMFKIFNNSWNSSKQTFSFGNQILDYEIFFSINSCPKLIPLKSKSN